MRNSFVPLALALSACCTSGPDSTESTAAAGSTAQYTFERGTPTGSTADDAYYASDLRRAIEAYKFFYPTMGSEAVMQQMLSNGAKVNEVGHVMATWPRIQFGAANSDTPYALATLDLNYQVRWWSSCRQVRLSPS